MGEHDKSRTARDTILEYVRENPGTTSYAVGKAYYESHSTSGMEWNRVRGGTWAKRHLAALRDRGLVRQKKRGEWYVVSLPKSEHTLEEYKGRSNYVDAVIDTLESDGQVVVTRAMFLALVKDLSK
jgi:hypothetical protein